MVNDSVSKKDAEEAWYDNSRTVIVLLTILASAVSLPYFFKLQTMVPTAHPVLPAIAAGVIVALVTFPPMRFADPKYALSNSVLLGLLVAEFNIYGAPYEFPAPIAIAFFFFMYLFGRGEAAHLWPENPENVIKKGKKYGYTQ